MEGIAMTPIEQQIEKVVDAILCDYQQERDIDRMETRRKPDKDAIIDIIEKLRRIVFPGYFREKNYRVYNAKHNLSLLIEDVMFNMTKQIALVFQDAGELEESAQAHAQEVCLEFFRQIPQVRALVQTDLQAAYDGDPAATSMAEIIFAYPGLFAITVYRLAHVLYTLKVPMIPRIMTEHAHSVTGIDIHPGAQIGEYFFIDHGTGIVIGETAIIGDYVKIYQGVTIGALSTRKGQALSGIKRHPTIEDHVIIYANATILGGDTVVGRNATVAGNTFVTESIPADAKVSAMMPELKVKMSGVHTKE